MAQRAAAMTWRRAPSPATIGPTFEATVGLGRGEERPLASVAMTSYPIRIFGDPVLKRAAREVSEIDGSFAKLVDTMFTTMYDAPGVGLAAPQIGVQQRFFVYDIGDDPRVVINPTVVEAEGEWTYEEGCLSIPGLTFEIVRPKVVTVRGIDLDGNEIVVQGDELLGRVFLHEIDHLDGVLMLDRLSDVERRAALREWRTLEMNGGARRDSDHAL